MGGSRHPRKAQTDPASVAAASRRWLAKHHSPDGSATSREPAGSLSSSPGLGRPVFFGACRCRLALGEKLMRDRRGLGPVLRVVVPELLDDRLNGGLFQAEQFSKRIPSAARRSMTGVGWSFARRPP
jgi:hypothetical protein